MFKVRASFFCFSFRPVYLFFFFESQETLFFFLFSPLSVSVVVVCI